MRKFSLLAPALAGFLCCAPALRSQSTFTQNFAADPASAGWRAYGDSTLYQWNTNNQNLQVTWDSSRSNSYFLRPLGTALTKRDDFSFAFDLQLQDIAVGTTPGKPLTFQFAAGLIRLADATATNFFRGTGSDSPNVVEFDYFPDSGFGATVSPTIISSNMDFASGFNSPFEMTTNDLFHIAMAYTASNQTLVTTMTRNDLLFGPIDNVVLGANFSDFQVDTFAVCGYSDAGQDPQFAGSILAHGVIDNISVTTPEPPISNLSGHFSNGVWQAEYAARAGWTYVLERTTDFPFWTGATAPTPGIDGPMVLVDTNAPGARAFYRVHAGRP